MFLINVVAFTGTLAVSTYIHAQKRRPALPTLLTPDKHAQANHSLVHGVRQAAQDVVQSVTTQGKQTRDGLRIGFQYTQRYWRPYWRQGAIIVGCLLSYQGVRMVAVYGLKIVVDAATGVKTVALLPILAGTLIVGFPIALWLDYQAEQRTARYGSYIANDLRADLFDHLQTLPYGFLQKSKPGDIASRFVTDIEMIHEGVAVQPTRLVSGLAVLALTVPMLLALNWRLTLLAFGPLPVTVLLFNYFSAKAIRSTYGFKQEEGLVNNFVQESIRIQPLVRSFDGEENLDRRFQIHQEAILTQQYGRERQLANLRVTASQFVFISSLLSTAVGGLFVINQTMTAGSLVAFTSLLQIVHNELTNIIKWKIPTIVSAAGAELRLEEIFAQRATLVDRSDAYALPRFCDAIRFENVSFRYEDHQSQLEQISFTIPKGKTVAITGPSGAGKSTIVSLLMRLYDPQEGCITIDGHDLRGLTLSSLHQQITIVFQEPLLFDATIAENLRIARADATVADMIDATQQAEIHNFIMTLPAGYQTVIGERGSRLSGGQQQRIAIARALLRNPEIIILDEITAGLDRETSAAIWQTLRNNLAARTVILISHNDMLLHDVDHIITIANGQIVS